MKLPNSWTLSVADQRVSLNSRVALWGVAAFTSVGCYAAGTRTPDACALDAPVIDVGRDAPALMGDGFVAIDAPLPPWERAIAEGCAGAEPNMIAVASDPRDPIWMGVHRVGPVAWRLIQARPRRRIWVVEGEDEAVTAYVRIDGHRTSLDVGTYSPVTRVDDIRTTRVCTGSA